LNDEIISERVYPHHFWLSPAACGCRPATGMKLASLFINISPLLKNCYLFAAMALLLVIHARLVGLAPAVIA